MKVYEPRDLKEQFRDLMLLQDISVIPIMDRAIEKFLKDIKEDPEKYGVSGVSFFQIPHSMDISYNLIGGEEKLTIVIQKMNLSFIREDPNWWMGFKVRIEGSEELCSKIFSDLKEFIGQLNLKALKEEATVILTKGKTYNLNGEMYNFYLDI